MKINRGVEKVLIFCVDGLAGFKESIEAVYPFARIQRCIIHQIRSSMMHITFKDRKAFVKNLKTIYGAVNEDQGTEHLLELKKNGVVSIQMLLVLGKTTEIIYQNSLCFLIM